MSKKTQARRSRRQRAHLLLSLAGSLSFLVLSCKSAWGQNKRLVYYTQELYQSVAAGLRGDEFKRRLYEVLSQTHQQLSEDQEIISSGGCSLGKKCYRHQSIGYDAARVFLMGQFYLVQQGSEYAVKDVYCDRLVSEREFSSQPPRPGRIPNPNVVNAEHTWPQSHFVRHQPKDLQKSDLHHLFPTDSDLNSARGSHPFGEVVKETQSLECSHAMMGRGDKASLVFEPPQNHKGNVARALFYFSVRYQANLDEGQERTLRDWHRLDPVDEEELKRNQAIFELQGNRNPFIDHPEWVDLIVDF
jgi:deoxyribonuclease-1